MEYKFQNRYPTYFISTSDGYVSSFNFKEQDMEHNFYVFSSQKNPKHFAGFKVDDKSEDRK